MALAVPAMGQAADYPVSVHVTTSRMGKDCGEVTKGSSGCKVTQVLDVVIDGTKYELQAETLLAKGVVALGDYKARLVSDKKKPTNEIMRQYELQFPDRSTRKFEVIGVME